MNNLIRISTWALSFLISACASIAPNNTKNSAGTELPSPVGGYQRGEIYATKTDLFFKGSSLHVPGRATITLEDYRAGKNTRDFPILGVTAAGTKIEIIGYRTEKNGLISNNVFGLIASGPFAGSEVSLGLVVGYDTLPGLGYAAAPDNRVLVKVN